MLTMLPSASLFLSAGAHAQANACEQLKTTLAARIEATGVRGYSLDIVPAGTPVPPDAKAIGNCEGGARKVLYRRWGATRATPGEVGAAGPAPAPQATAPPSAPTRRPPVVQGERASQPLPAPVPAPAPPSPVLRSSVAALAASASGRATERTLVIGADKVAPVRVADPATTQRVQETTSGAPVVATAPLSQPASDLMAGHWQWLWVLLLLPIAAGLWAWLAHRSAYDEAGLPRGPKL